MRINNWLVCALVVGAVLVAAGFGQNPAFGQTLPLIDGLVSAQATTRTAPSTTSSTDESTSTKPTGAESTSTKPDESTTQDETSAQTPTRRQLTHIRVLARDRHVERTRHWRPWSQPTPSQIHRIIEMEAARWGAPASRLRCRINGESGFRWYASNGQYQGLGQFGAETFSRGMQSIGSRRVGYDRTTTARRWQSRVRAYSDGSTRMERKWRKVDVTYTTHYRGVLPANPPRTHGYAQVRIMARAMVGLGNVNDSEWEVRC